MCGMCQTLSAAEHRAQLSLCATFSPDRPYLHLAVSHTQPVCAPGSPCLSEGEMLASLRCHCTNVRPSGASSR